MNFATQDHHDLMSGILGVNARPTQASTPLIDVRDGLFDNVVEGSPLPINCGLDSPV